MQNYGQAALPTLRLDRMKQAKKGGAVPSARVKVGSNTARAVKQNPIKQPSAPAQPKTPNPPQHRRGYGFTTIASDAQPQTTRHHKHKHSSDAKPTQAPVPPTQALTARPPTNEKSRRPRSGRQQAHTPVTSAFCCYYAPLHCFAAFILSGTISAAPSPQHYLRRRVSACICVSSVSISLEQRLCVSVSISLARLF